MRSYCSEPDRGRRRWKGKHEEQAAVYANRRRIRGAGGKGLLKQRGEKIERSFAHCYETGSLRRVSLRRHGNILKRLLVHGAAFNLGLVMRKISGHGTPRGLQGYRAELFFAFWRLLSALWRSEMISSAIFDALRHSFGPSKNFEPSSPVTAKIATSATGC